ncbi:MAG: hypothetical protein QM820_55070 [Minicystis sp.]
MTPFRRQPQPEFWAAREQRWLALAPGFGERDPLNDWQYQKRSLGFWFRSLVRAADEPRLCAYCDGSLTEQSRETIDHYLPQHEFPELAVSWWNLFPACDRCNSEYKRTRWSCRLVRPDTDPVEAYFDFDEITGWLRPGAHLDWATRVSVRLTIRVLRLNDEHRCKGRLRVLNEMRNAHKRDAKTRERDGATLQDRAARGPYRFVARRFLDAVPPSYP